MASRSDPRRWASARRILCVRLDGLGDVLMCTPALRALKAVRPDRRLTLLCSDAGAALADHLPDVDDVIAFGAPWVKGPPDGTATVGAPDRWFPDAFTAGAADATDALIGLLASRSFDAAVLMTTHTQSVLPAALLCLLARIPLRLGHCRENPYRLLTDWIDDSDSPAGTIRHEVTRQLDLVARIGARTDDTGLSFALRPVDVGEAGSWLRSRAIADGTPYLLVHPGATAPSRRYPVEHFIDAIAAIRRELHCPIVVSGGAGEASLCERIAASFDDCHDAAGALTLGGLAGLIASSRVMIACNSGPMHIAVALGRPTVVAYAMTNPQHTPWGDGHVVLTHDVPCRNCLKSQCPHSHHDCLVRIDPQRVAQAALALWHRQADALAPTASLA